jgi:hypothetical protein
MALRTRVSMIPMEALGTWSTRSSNLSGINGCEDFEDDVGHTEIVEGAGDEGIDDSDARNGVAHQVNAAHRISVESKKPRDSVDVVGHTEGRRGR